MTFRIYGESNNMLIVLTIAHFLHSYSILILPRMYDAGVTCGSIPVTMSQNLLWTITDAEFDLRTNDDSEFLPLRDPNDFSMR